MISLRPLSPERVLAFLPPNTWTEVILLSTPQNNLNAYIATTEEKLQKRWQDMNEMSIQSCLYEPVIHFKAREIVAVEIDGNWYRGKLIKLCLFNPDNTTIDLIDVGVTYNTKLENVFDLPYYFKYDPLILPIKFKNFIPNTTKVTVKPYMSESNLDEGVVLVAANGNYIQFENIQQYVKPQLVTKKGYKNKKITKGIKCESNDDTTIQSSSRMEQNEIRRNNYQYSHPRNLNSHSIKIERDKANGQIFPRSIKIENDTSSVIENTNETMPTNNQSFTDESYTTNASLHTDKNINIHKSLSSQKLIKRKKNNVKRQEKLPHNRDNSKNIEKEAKKQLAQDNNQQKQEQGSQSKPQGKNLNEEIRYRFEQLVKFTSQQLQEMNY